MVHFTFNISKLDHRYRNVSDRINAFKLLRQGIGEIILIHVRKAGGTTLRNWFTRMQYYLNRTQYGDGKNNEFGKDWRETFPKFHRVQGGTLASQIMNKYTKHSIWVISFRDPIIRILSQYDFEWRWLYSFGSYYDDLEFDINSFDRYNYWKHVENKNRTQRVINAKYKYASITLNEWIYRVNISELHNDPNIYQQTSPRVLNHMYLNNYYLWIFCCDTRFCNINRDFVQTGKIWECLVHAMELLLSFDIILITEWMNDVRSHLFVNKLFWDNLFDFKTIEHKFSQNRMNLPFPYHVKNRGHNLMINNKLKNSLMELNKWDIIFYQYAKQIAYHRMNFKDINGITLDFKDDIIFEFDTDAPEFYNQHDHDRILKRVLL